MPGDRAGDIVERLRQCGRGPTRMTADLLCVEAADEIERLRTMLQAILPFAEQAKITTRWSEARDQLCMKAREMIDA